MSDESRRQGVFEPLDEAGSLIRPPDGAPAPVPVRLSSRSIAISAISAVIALAYVCSPIDLVPEALVPVVGFVDDLLVLIGAAALVRAVLVAALAERDRRRQELDEYEETEPFVGKWSP